MHRCLFIPNQVVPEIGSLLQGLPETGQVPVPEDPEAAGKQSLLLSVPFGVLLSQVLQGGLSHGQSNCFHL